MSTEPSAGPRIETTPIPDLLVVRLPVHADARGWFKENWQRAKLTALGLPDFGPVQNNVSYNASRGSTRGIHAEPWDKYVSVAAGRVFGAWVDLRSGDSFGATFAIEMGPDVAVFVPRGVGNSYQALEDGTVYSYLVNDHWSPGRTYPALHLADADAAIAWPIPLDSPEVEISAKDRANPALDDVTPMAPRKTLVIGGYGQLGRALTETFPDATVVDRDALDLADPTQVAAWPWAEYGLVLNAAAHTAVDLAETDAGRADAWAVNAVAVARLAAVAREHRLTVVHYSTDYVYAGTAEAATEDEPLAPAGAYGQSKAAGDLAVAGVPRHYLLRTAWVVGEGHNFVRTMAGLAQRGVSPTVVDDQIGRLTFTSTLAAATLHLVSSVAPYGTYHVTNAGDPASWRDIAARVFELCGRSADDVTPTSTAAYAAERAGSGDPYAPRPRRSVLALDRLRATGFEPEDHLIALEQHLKR